MYKPKRPRQCDMPAPGTTLRALVLNASLKHGPALSNTEELAQLVLDHMREHDVLGNDEHVVALSHMGAVKEGRAIRVWVISVFHYRNGRQRERWFHPTDLETWDRLSQRRCQQEKSKSIRSMAGTPRRRNGTWSSETGPELRPGKTVARPARRAAARRRDHRCLFE